MNPDLAKTRRYLRSAEVLLDDGDPESAVSRAYYAVFYVARALLETKGQTFKTHNGLLSGFNLHFIRTGELDQRFGALLKRLFDARQLADYEGQTDLSETQIRDLITQVEEFIRVTESILATS